MVPTYRRPPKSGVPDGQRAGMTTEAFITALNQPSTVVLAVILTANLILPVNHFLGADPAQESDQPSTEQEVASRVVPDGVSPATAAAGNSAPEPARTRIRPTAPPTAATRVSLRKAAPVCRAWGPFNEMADAETTALQLALAPGTFEVYQSQVHSEPEYLVYVRAAESLEAAQQTLENLQHQGVDSYIMERGRTGNRLAVGVFSNLQRAETQLRRVSDLGHEGGIEPLERSRRIFHLMARMAPDRNPDVAPLGSCDDIAPLQQFL